MNSSSNSSSNTGGSGAQWLHSDYLDSSLFIEFDKCRIDEVCLRVESYLYSREECEYAMKALAIQAYSAVKASDALLVAEFLDAMACECIILSLKKHAAVSQEVAMYALSCIVSLSSYSIDLNDFFTALEAVELILFTISMHLGDEFVSELGTAAIVQLATGNTNNSSAVADGEGCDIMSQVGVFGLNLRNRRAAYVAMNVCNTFYLLAHAVNVRKLIECGACDLIVALVRAHESNIDIVVPGLRALCNLASLSFETREALGHGACLLATNVLRRYPLHVAALLGGCELAMHLALSPSNTAALAKADACSLLLSALDTHLLDEPHGAEVCVCAVLHMASFGFGALTQRAWLLDMGAERSMDAVLACTRSSHRAKEGALQVLELLESSRNRSRSNSIVSISSTNSSTQHSNASSTARASISSLAYTSSGGGGGSHGNPGNAKYVNTSRNVFVLGSRVTADTSRPLAVEIREYESFPSTDPGGPQRTGEAAEPIIDDETTAARKIVEL